MAECKYLYQETWYSESQLRSLYNISTGVRTPVSLTFLRHGITDEDDQKKNSGQNGESINVEGARETKETLEKDLQGRNIEVVYSSPTRRAMQTSQIISKDLKIPVVAIDGLEAWDLGKFASKPEKDLDERYYVNNPDVKIPGGESFNQFKNRVLQAMDEISQYPGKGAVLTHSKTLKLIEALSSTGGVWNQEAIDRYFSETDQANDQAKVYVYNKPIRDEDNIPSPAHEGTVKKMKEFLDRVGVDIKELADIKWNGKSLGVNGLMDPLNALIQVAEGKMDTVLPEEAMHVAVEIIQQKNPKLFKEMMDRIGRYNLTASVFAQYQNNPFYQTKEGKPDIVKIKKEAIGKLLAQTVINQNEDVNEKPELLLQVKDWWQKILDFLKDLFLRAGFNPFEKVAQDVLKGKDIGTFDRGGSPFASRNENVVNATLKLVDSLRNPKADRWFKDMFQKGNKGQFFQKLQQDLQAPKAQVEMLMKWAQGKEFNNLGEIITGVMSELSYTVEINTSIISKERNIGKFGELHLTKGQEVSVRGHEGLYRAINDMGETINQEDFIPSRSYDLEPIDNEYDPETNPNGRHPLFNVPDSYIILEEKSFSQVYSSLTVPGGTNYRENEIKTPDITPSIKGHAAFATDQGIGWFRSDDKREVSSNSLVTSDHRIKQLNSYNNDQVELDSNRYYKDSTGQWWKGGEIDRTKTRRILEIQSDLFQKGRNREQLAVKKIGTSYSPEAGELEDFGAAEESKNDFLQLLNKENNWVTFFVKSIIQDSAKKGYENVRFPGGSTAAKVEGHETVEEYIKSRENLIKEGEKRLETARNTNLFYYTSRPYYEEGGKHYTEDSGVKHEISKEKYEETKEKYIEDLGGDIKEFKKEIEEARAGNASFQAIANFYQNTVQNILKKQGYKPIEVTDEHGNKWFEVSIEDKYLGDFYFQLASPQDLSDKINQKNVNISKRGDEYEINGSKIKRTIKKEVEDFYKDRLKANYQKAFNQFKAETENKVKQDIKDILSRYIDQDGKLRQTINRQANPSAVDPYNNDFYATLEAHLAQRLNSYEAGTTFFNSTNIFDGVNTAGTADFIAVTPQGKVDILQFKVPQLSSAGEIATYRQEAYNTEIEAIRKVLQKGYGVKRGDFRYTRAIPIKAQYQQLMPGISDLELISLTVGNVNVALVNDDILIPIPSESESTGDEQFDEFIERLKGLAKKLAQEKVSPDKRLERTQRVAALVAAIRKLQIRKEGGDLVTSANTIIKAQKVKYNILQEKMSNTDPELATIEELNKMADDILGGKDELEIYRDMYEAFENIFDDGSPDSEELLKDARSVSDDARQLINKYWKMSVDFRKGKLSAKVGISDEFTPEKRLTWYRRMVRSLSQSQIKAGAILWKLVERINNKFKHQFLERLDDLGEIEKRVKDWMKGKPVQALYDKIFQYDDKGRWTGKIIKKYSKEFYSELEKAQEKRDLKWVHDNIDIDEYKKWFVKEHQRMIDNSKTARVHPDDTENARLIQQGLQDFVANFGVDYKRGITSANYMLKSFPKGNSWYSDKYKDLLTPGNESVKEVYDYWEKRLDESWKSGMFEEYMGSDWFPNIRRGITEKLSTAPAGDKIKSFLGAIRIEAEDQLFGKIDPITGKPVDEIHAHFVRDLGTYVQEVNDGYWDYSEKSMDIFNVMALWDAEILKFQLRSESEALARLLYYTEVDERRKAYDSGPTGKLKRSKDTGRPILVSNETNASYIKEYLDAIYYGKDVSNEFDVTVNIPWGAAVRKINSMFGKEMITQPEEDEIKLSGVKLISTMNRYFVTKTLGINVMTSVAQLFGGTTNILINQGIYFNKKDVLEAELMYTSGKFWADMNAKKMAGLIGFIHPYMEDRTMHIIRNMSLSGLVRHFSSDHLFFMQRGADNWVNSIVAISMINNSIVVDGKIVNIRDFARKELGHINKYSGTYEHTVKFNEDLEKRVAELKKSPQALLNYATVVNDQITLPNIPRDADTVGAFRQQILEIIKDALGNTSREDLSLYKRYVMWQSFFMFKNWIPRMADVRFRSLSYSPGTQQYEYGRVRMLWNAVFSKNRSSISGLLKLLGGNDEPLIDVAKREYERKKAAFQEEMQDLDMNEAEFVDMYIKGVRSEMKEVMLAVGLMSILVAARVAGPDKDDDPHLKGAYRWALKGLDKLTDELTFMYSPKSFTDIVNGSIFPAAAVLVDAQRLFTVIIEKLFYKAIGKDEIADRKKVAKYLFRMMPITKELITYVALFNADLAKDLGVRMTTQYGSIR